MSVVRNLNFLKNDPIKSEMKSGDSLMFLFFFFHFLDFCFYVYLYRKWHEALFRLCEYIFLRDMVSLSIIGEVMLCGCCLDWWTRERS